MADNTSREDSGAKDVLPAFPEMVSFVAQKVSRSIGHFEKYHNTLLCASSALIGRIYSSLLC